MLAVLLSTTWIVSVSAATSLQIEIRDVPLTEARGVIDRTLGSGSVDLARGEELLSRTRGHVIGASQQWFKDHADAKIVGAVPFYGPRNLAVATEYYIGCGDKICGSLYDAFPDATTIDGAIDLFQKGGRCLTDYACDTGGNLGLSLRTFFVPNAVPVSIRLAASIPTGRMKFYHGIYAIAETDRQVVSLDPQDAGLTRRALKQRLVGLADLGTSSPSIPLILKRSRLRSVWPWPDGTPTLEQSRTSEAPFTCTKFGPLTTRTINVANGDGTFHQETVRSSRPVGSLYAPDCVGLSLTEPLLYGNYSFIGTGFDYLTGRAGSSFYQMYSRLDISL